MTRVILILNLDYEILHVAEDPRSPRELVIAINSGQEVWTGGAVQALTEKVFPAGRPRKHKGEQWAMAHQGVETVTVMQTAPPVRLSARQYQVLYGLVDGLTPAQIAAQLGVTTRVVYLHTAGLRERFAAQNQAEIVHKALEWGMVEGSDLSPHLRTEEKKK